MTDSFDKRGKSFEEKFSHDEAVDFKMQAKAVRLFGLWAAAKLGLEGEAVEPYVLEVMDADFERAGVGDVIEKVKKDFDAKGIEVSQHHLENEYGQHLKEAIKQMAQG
ncbi:MAG: DUF1476 family protein [Alphaproteobacteria bacterium]|nr:DUF1476 family protein [Alphaproteobacteria bacterium]